MSLLLQRRNQGRMQTPVKHLKRSVLQKHSIVDVCSE